MGARNLKMIGLVALGLLLSIVVLLRFIDGGDSDGLETSSSAQESAAQAAADENAGAVRRTSAAAEASPDEAPAAANEVFVSGVVLDEAGGPIAGATIMVSQPESIEGGSIYEFRGFNEELKRVTTSDQEGGFSLSGPWNVGDWCCAIITTAPGYEPALLLTEGCSPEQLKEIEIRLKPGRRLSVLVRSAADGSPIPGAGVTVTPMGWDEGMGILSAAGVYEQHCDQEGRLLLDNLGSRGCLVRVLVPGYRGPKEVRVKADSEEAIIELEPAGIILARVVEERSGRPAAEVKVTPMPSAGYLVRPPVRVIQAAVLEQELGIAAQQGLFALVDLTTAALSFRIEAPGLVTAEFVCEGLGSGERRRIDCALPPSGSITGRILAADGRPRAGASVTAVFVFGPSDDDDDDAAERALLGGDTSGLEQAALRPSFSLAKSIMALSAEDGSFSIAGLGVGLYRLEASHPEERDLDPPDFNIGEGQELKGLELRFSSSGRIAGRVVDGVTGAPLWARVSLHPKPAEAAAGGNAAVFLDDELACCFCGEDDDFQFKGLDAGSYRIVVDPSSRADPSGTVFGAAHLDVVVVSGKTNEVVIRLTAVEREER